MVCYCERAMTRILSIETSCDETALSVIEASGTLESPEFQVLGNVIASQAELHAEFGGVFPNLAKREHAKIITHLLETVLGEAKILEEGKGSKKIDDAIRELDREPEAQEPLRDFVKKYTTPDIDIICVTSGPGLEPALWVGINFAKALSILWDKPVVPVNHMEGHISSVLIQELNASKKIEFPAIALLVSGGHTELHKVNGWNQYELIGATKDDAVGEAFDKVARLLGLPYPGGPKISTLADEARQKGFASPVLLPRPMLHSHDYSFSYSGLKTAVLYAARDLGDTMTETMKAGLAAEFENAAIEVLVKKTVRAAEEFQVRSIIVGGGVAANTHLRSELASAVQKIDESITIFFPGKGLSTDNSVMIGLAGYFAYLKNDKQGAPIENIRANGNLKIN